MNVVVYVLDSLRADHLSCYGYERDTSPTIDSLAAEGYLFEQCVSPSVWTKPVAASLLSGFYPPVHGIFQQSDTYAPPVQNLPEIFQRNGYDTILIGSGNMNSQFGFDQGFGTYVDSIDADVPLQSEATAMEATRGYQINRTMTEWLDDRDGDDPFFALLWSTGTHLPYAPPEGHRKFLSDGWDGPAELDKSEPKDKIIDNYDSEIAYNDQCIHTLREELRRRGEFEDTLFVILSDHGDMFGEHGAYGHGNHILPYEELIHVPMVIRPPDGGAQDPTQISELSSIVDLYTTLPDLADIQTDARLTQGISLAPAMAGETTDEHRPVYTASRNIDRGKAIFAIREGGWKYIDIRKLTDPESSETPSDDSSTAETDGGLIPTPVQKFLSQPVQRQFQILSDPIKWYHVYKQNNTTTSQLYDLTADGSEATNLIEQRQDQAKNLEHTLDEWLTECESLATQYDANDGTTEISGDLRETLSDLGYLDR